MGISLFTIRKNKLASPNNCELNNIKNSRYRIHSIITYFQSYDKGEFIFP